jgi:hypothetical protein
MGFLEVKSVIFGPVLFQTIHLEMLYDENKKKPLTEGAFHIRGAFLFDYGLPDQ